MASYLWDNTTSQWLPREEALRNRAIAEAATSKRSRDVACPMIISDSLDDMRSMIDGQIYTSKRAYYDSVKAHGCQIVGNDTTGSWVSGSGQSDAAHEADIAADVKKTIQELT